VSLSALLPILALLSSLLAAVVIFALPEASHRLRILVNLLAALVKLGIVAVMTWGVFHGLEFSVSFTMLPGVSFMLQADALAMLFAGLSAVLWLFTTIYAVGYLEDSPNRSRFFGFFSLCVASTMGIALAGNLFTFFLFYEMLTLSTYPLVVHRGTEKALQAGRNYIIYTLGGGVVLLLGIAWLHGLAGDLAFQETGHFQGVDPALHGQLTLVFALLIAGLLAITVQTRFRAAQGQPERAAIADPPPANLSA
jgi:multicomponent Na+:H+ antiporter subunit D